MTRLNKLVLFISVTLITTVIIEITQNIPREEAIYRGIIATTILNILVEVVTRYGHTQMYLIEKWNLPYKRVYVWYMTTMYLLTVTLIVLLLGTLLKDYSSFAGKCAFLYGLIVTVILIKVRTLYRYFRENIPVDMYGNRLYFHKKIARLNANGEVHEIDTWWIEEHSDCVYYRTGTTRSIVVEVPVWQIYPR